MRNEERPQYMFVHIAGRDWRRVEEENVKGTHVLLLIYFSKGMLSEGTKEVCTIPLQVPSNLNSHYLL